MDVSDNSAQDVFRATETARLVFLAAVKGMTSGDHPLDLDHLIRLVDTLFEAHYQAVVTPRRLTESETVRH